MTTHVQIGGSCTFRLQRVILVYGDGSHALATVHEPRSAPDGGAPYLGPGRPLSEDFLRTLAEGLGRHARAEVLPENVLARTPEMIAWWSPAQHRRMFFPTRTEELARLNGRRFPHPPLVFKLRGRQLLVRALAENVRPTEKTRLMTAPYWNTNERGLVCLGTTRVPPDGSVAAIDGWERGFFESEFTHAYGGARMTKYRGGVLALWKCLADSPRPFPVEHLTNARQTLRALVEDPELA